MHHRTTSPMFRNIILLMITLLFGFFQHGEDTPIEAAQRADAMLEAGDLGGHAVWLRIVKAVGELLEQKPSLGALIQSGVLPSYLKSTNSSTNYKGKRSTIR